MRQKVTGTDQYNVLLRILPSGANGINRSAGDYPISEFAQLTNICHSGRQMITVNSGYILSSTFTLTNSRAGFY
jgi:hypothetical protein